MNPKLWQHDHPEERHISPMGSLCYVLMGGFMGFALLWWVIKPLWLDPSPTSPLPTLRGITISGADQPHDPIDLTQATTFLIDAIIEIESQGNPHMVGSVGERGLMQIREGTWKDVTRKHLGGEISFSRAFEPELNRQVGQYYLGDLQVILYKNKDAWASDLRSLLLASYNAGPEYVKSKGYNLKRMSKKIQSYAARGSALHDWYLSADAGDMHQILINAAETQ